MWVAILAIVAITTLFILWKLYVKVNYLRDRVIDLDRNLSGVTRQLREMSGVSPEEKKEPPEMSPKVGRAEREVEPPPVFMGEPQPQEYAPAVEEPAAGPEPEAPFQTIAAGGTQEKEEAAPVESSPEPLVRAPARSHEPEFNLEARVGGTWSLRIGLVLLAIGVAFFARLITPMLGPTAKVALAYAGSFGLFAVGKVFERKLQNFARPVMAGGLALGFFVSFSSHFIPAMRCLPLPGCLAWMSAGVLAILIFADRWKSQPTAGLAIFLGHVSAFVAAGDADAFSLIVIVFLSATAVLMFLRHNWLPLSLFAVVAAYFSHLLWVSVEHVQTTPELAFWINLSFLSSYYFIFQASDLIWWRRLNINREDAFSLTQRTVGRILGPLNLVFYVSFISFLYVRTEIYLSDIHWFFFGLAALQGLLGLVLKSFNNEDYIFYPAIGVILATIGFFSAFEALTLNLVLASEAIILLLAAHRTRIWVFHLFAQVVLALNFVHYWVYTSGQPSTAVYFAGGLATAAVYFVKASLEEIWYGGGERFEWTGVADKGAVSKALAEKFDVVYSGIAPHLSYIHAAAGALILVNQCMRHLSEPNAALAISLAVLAFAFLGLLRRSVSLLVGYLFIQGGLVYFMFSALFENSEITPWLEWGVAICGLVACCALVMTIPHRMRNPRHGLAAMVVGHLALWCNAAIVFICLRYGQENRSLYLAWIAAIALIYFYLDRGAARLHNVDKVEGGILRGFAVVSSITSIIGALLIAIATRENVAVDIATPVWLVLWSAVIIALAGIRRNRDFYFSGALVLLICYLDLLWERPLALRVMDNTAATLWLVIVTVGIAYIQDILLCRVSHSWTSRSIRGAEAATYIPYAYGLLFLTAFLYHRTSFPWSIVILAMCSIGLYAVTSPFGMRRGALASFLLLLLAHGIGFARFADLHAFPVGMLVLAVVFFAEAIAFERLLAFRRGLEFQIRIKNVEGQVQSYNITPFARDVLIVALTGVIMMAIYHSALLGPKWTTAGWSFAGATVVALGFAWRSAGYRRTALAVFALCLIRVFLVDTRDLGDTYKMLAFITLGVCLLLMAWLYSRFEASIRKWL